MPCPASASSLVGILGELGCPRVLRAFDSRFPEVAPRCGTMRPAGLPVHLPLGRAVACARIAGSPTHIWFFAPTRQGRGGERDWVAVARRKITMTVGQ